MPWGAGAVPAASRATRGGGCADTTLPLSKSAWKTGIHRLCRRAEVTAAGDGKRGWGRGVHPQRRIVSVVTCWIWAPPPTNARMVLGPRGFITASQNLQIFSISTLSRLTEIFSHR